VRAGVEIAEDMGLKPELGDQKSYADNTVGVGEAPVASTDEAAVKATRRARSAYLIARIKNQHEVLRVPRLTLADLHGRAADMLGHASSTL